VLLMALLVVFLPLLLPLLLPLMLMVPPRTLLAACAVQGSGRIHGWC
jgi:hypothetical protein